MIHGLPGNAGKIKSTFMIISDVLRLEFSLILQIPIWFFDEFSRATHYDSWTGWEKNCVKEGNPTLR